MNDKPELFQLQKFYNKRHLWKNCFPEFIKKCEEVEKVLKELGNQSFTITAAPRKKLMDWFLNKIKNVDNIKSILKHIPDNEYIPIDGEKLTKDQFYDKYYVKRNIIQKTKKDLRKESGGKKIFRVVANFHAVGGGELSVINIMKMFSENGYKVIFHPTNGTNSNLVKRLPDGVKIENSILGGYCDGVSDIFFVYSNDFVYKFNKCKDNLTRLMDKSKRNVICLNFVMGESWQPWFSSRLDKALFLNSTKEVEYINRLRDKKLGVMPTFSLAPPVFLDEYLLVKPDYSKINFVRTGRYGGKYDEAAYLTLLEEWKKIIPDAKYYFMATPPFIKKRYGGNPNFNCYNWDQTSIPKILSKGSIFHYHLPIKLCDQGPRVLVESSASGLATIAQPRWGPKDRIVDGKTGWLVESVSDFINVVKEIKDNIGLLKERGEAARQYAIENFDPYLWVKKIEIN